MEFSRAIAFLDQPIGNPDIAGITRIGYGVGRRSGSSYNAWASDFDRRLGRHQNRMLMEVKRSNYWRSDDSMGDFIAIYSELIAVSSF
jgi:hypothetical protein